MTISQALQDYRKRLLQRQQDHEFMPEVEGAILEDSPIAARATLWISCALLLCAVAWAHFAVLDEVTVGEGKVIPSSKVQVIQNLEGGIVADIFVREGQIVNKGDTLLRLDDTRFRSNQGETDADRLALIARVERLSAESEERAPQLPQEVSTKMPQLAEDELALYRSRQQRLSSDLAGLNEQLRQKTQELAEFRAKQEQYRSGLGLIQQELGMSQPLVGTGAISPVEILRLRRSAVEMRGSLDSTTLAIPRAEAAVAEIKNKIDSTKLTFREESLKELNQARTDLQKAKASSVALDDQVSRTTVVSPVYGVIKQLKVNTKGGVVQPGSDLLEIVPLEDTLLVEAKVRPQDVAFLRPGLKAMVKFTAYDFTIYGGLPGKLELIGADTISDDKGNSFYLIQVRTEKNHLGTVEKPLLLIPGMVASVDIITGHKSVLDYLLKPVLKARWEALRER